MCATHGEEVHFACAGCTYTDESKTHRRMVCALAARPPALRSKIHARIRTKSTSHSVRSLHCTTSSAKVVGPTRIPSGRTPQTRHFRSERVRCNLPDSASSPTHGTCQSSPCALWPKLASAAVRAPRNEAIEKTAPDWPLREKTVTWQHIADKATQLMNAQICTSYLAWPPTGRSTHQSGPHVKQSGARPPTERAAGERSSSARKSIGHSTKCP